MVKLYLWVMRVLIILSGMLQNIKKLYNSPFGLIYTLKKNKSFMKQYKGLEKSGSYHWDTHCINNSQNNSKLVHLKNQNNNETIKSAFWNFVKMQNEHIKRHFCRIVSNSAQISGFEFLPNFMPRSRKEFPNYEVC